MTDAHSFLTRSGQTQFDLSPTANPPLGMPSTLQRIGALALGTILVLTVAACASDRGSDSQQAQVVKSRQSHVAASKREAELNAAWRGHRYEELLEQFGEPVSKINMIGQRAAMTTLVLFGVDAKSKCLDAFTMVKDERTGHWAVQDYFCR